MSGVQVVDPVLQRYINMLPVPEKRDDSKWDAIFLFEPRPNFEDYVAWFWSVFVARDGEQHAEWLRLQTLTHDPKYKDQEWLIMSRLVGQAGRL